MKNKIEKYICSVIVCITCIAVSVLDSVNVLAASFDESIEEAEWRYYHVADKDAPSSQVSGFDNLLQNMPDTDYPDADAAYTYSEHCSVLTGDDRSSMYYLSNYTFSSNSEIVLYFDESVEIDEFYTNQENYAICYALSNSQIKSVANYYRVEESVWNNISRDEVFIDYQRSVTYKDVKYYYYTNSGYSQSPYSGGFNFALKSGSMKVFDSFYSALRYLKNGDETGLAWCGKSKEYDGEAYLENFQMIVHDSNAYSAYYIEFKYTIPDKLKDCSSLYLDIDEEYSMNIRSFGVHDNSFQLLDNDVVDLLENPTGFCFYLDDFSVLSQLTTASSYYKRAILGGGDKSLGDLDFTVGGVKYVFSPGKEQITISKLYITCGVVADYSIGQSVVGVVDFLSGANNISSYTPDLAGNYTYNNDYQSSGRYYDLVGIDAAGNGTHSYYYYSTDNSKTEISANDYSNNTFSPDIGIGGGSGSTINNIVTIPEHIFVTVSGGSGSTETQPDITIEDDDLSFDSLRDSIKDGYGLIDDIDTGAKGDGLIAMMSDLFAYLPSRFVGLIMLGTSSVVGIAILRMIFKR